MTSRVIISFSLLTGTLVGTACTDTTDARTETAIERGWDQELAAFDAGAIRALQGSSDLSPYDGIMQSANDADEIMNDGWQFHGEPTFRIVPPVAWDHLVEENRSWNFNLHSWRPINSILASYATTRAPRYLQFALAFIEDWVASNPYELGNQAGGESFAWYDMAVGLRVYRLAFVIAASARAGEVSDEQLVTLWQSLVDHLRYLANDENISFHNNHGFFQAAGQLAAASRLSPALEPFRLQALERVRQMVAQQFSEECVHLEHSPGYHRMVLDSLRAITRCNGFEDGGSIVSQLVDCEDALAWMILPNQRLANLGDTHYRDLSPDRDEPAIQSSLLQYALSGGTRGEPARTRLGVFPESGLAVLRSGWPGEESSTDASYLAQQCAFHSRAHKQADDLSFIWYDRGSEILIDAGRFSYLGRTQPGSELHDRGFWYSDPRRIYVESTRAHNTVEIDGRDFERKGRKPFGSAIERWGETADGLQFIETHVRHFKTMRHARVLIVKPHGWLLVFDWLWDNVEARHDYRQRFQFAPTLDVRRGASALQASGGTLDGNLSVVSLLDGVEVRGPIRGQEEPQLLGWWAPSDKDLEPTTAVSFDRTGVRSTSFATLFSFGDGVTPDHESSSVNTAGREALLQWSESDGTHTLLMQRPQDGEITIEYRVE